MPVFPFLRKDIPYVTVFFQFIKKNFIGGDGRLIFFPCGVIGTVGVFQFESSIFSFDTAFLLTK